MAWSFTALFQDAHPGVDWKGMAFIACESEKVCKKDNYT
jgi:hypothetical protein